MRARAVALNNADVSMLIDADRRPVARAGRYRAGFEGAERIILMGRHKDRTGLGRFFGATDVAAERGKEGTSSRSVTLTDGEAPTPSWRPWATCRPARWQAGWQAGSPSLFACVTRYLVSHGTR
ncbi:hypothetical protein ACWEF9_30380 [Streptomyces sp. NPDC004980]